MTEHTSGAVDPRTYTFEICRAVHATNVNPRDTKSLLISHLEAVEGLLSVGFAPTRTVLLSYGFDEESMLEVGRGASYLSAHIESIYGKDSIELLVDEGGGARQEMWGRAFFLPGMGEKGYVDVYLFLSPFSPNPESYAKI